MDKTTYLQALAVAEKELTEIKGEQEKLALMQLELEKRALMLSETVSALQTLLNTGARQTSPILRLGLTDAVREILRVSSSWITPSAIKAKLEQVGYEFGAERPVSAIATILARQPDVEMMGGDGGKAYRLRPNYGATNSIANQMARGELPTAEDAAAEVVRRLKKDRK